MCLNKEGRKIRCLLLISETYLHMYVHTHVHRFIHWWWGKFIAKIFLSKMRMCLIFNPKLKMPIFCRIFQPRIFQWSFTAPFSEKGKFYIKGNETCWSQSMAKPSIAMRLSGGFEASSYISDINLSHFLLPCSDSPPEGSHWMQSESKTHVTLEVCFAPTSSQASLEFQHTALWNRWQVQEDLDSTEHWAHLVSATCLPCPR